MADKVEIKFQVMKNGQKVAYKWSRKAMRWFRMSLDEAQLLVATEQATVTK